MQFVKREPLRVHALGSSDGVSQNAMAQIASQALSNALQGPMHHIPLAFEPCKGLRSPIRWHVLVPARHAHRDCSAEHKTSCDRKG